MSFTSTEDHAWLAPAGALVALLLLWAVLAAIYPAILVPSPLAVGQALWRLAVEGVLWREVVITLGRLAVAFAAAVVAGIGLGLVAGEQEWLAGVLRPLVGAASGIPPIAWLALALIWFGSGGFVAVFVALLVAFPAIYVATADGVRALDRDLLAMARVFGVRGYLLLREVYLPALAPHIFSGLTVGAALAVRVGVMGEFLASTSGLGSALALARTQLDTAQVLAWLFVALAIIYTVEGLLLRPLARRASRWREGSK